jgi:D-alanine-D-alanine ligase
MTRTIVGVLRGGTGSEYDLSLKTGAAMMQALPEERYDTRDILIDKSGLWHLRGQPVTPARALAQLDVALNAIHGGIGEDGTIQRILRRASIPYTGSGPLPSALSLNKIRAREALTKAGLRMPRAITFSTENALNTSDMAQAVFSQFGPPYVVKPPTEGASKGIIIARTFLNLPDAIGDILDKYGTALIEEYVMGEEASVGVVENFRGEDLYALPPAHVHRDGPYVAYRHHEGGLIRHSVPSRFPYEHKISLESMAKAAHQALGLSHFSRSDIILTPRAAYLLEVNSIPGLYPSATFPSMLGAVGSSVQEFLEHAIHLARSRK